MDIPSDVLIRNHFQSECNELILKFLLHSPITIIAIWRGRDAKHTMTKAVTTAKENENRYLFLRQAQIEKHIMPRVSYVLPGKSSQLPSRLPYGRYSTVSRGLLLLCCV